MRRGTESCAERARGQRARNSNRGCCQSGGPVAAIADSGFGFTQNVLQLNDNVTLMKGNHAFKAGLDLQWVADTHQRCGPSTFPNTAACLAARDGGNRMGYTTLTMLRPAGP